MGDKGDKLGGLVLPPAHKGKNAIGPRDRGSHHPSLALPIKGRVTPVAVARWCQKLDVTLPLVGRVREGAGPPQAQSWLRIQPPPSVPPHKGESVYSGGIQECGVIPAEAGIHVRGDPHPSSAGIAFSMDSGLRRNDIVID